VIATADSHPFWVVTDEPDLERAARGTVDENGVWLYHENIDPGLNGFWVEAKDLHEGDVFLGANGELLTLVAQERVEFEESITVYNFTVDGNHNYFVIAAEDEYGQTCVLVHNAGYIKLLIDLATKGANYASKWLKGAPKPATPPAATPKPAPAPAKPPAPPPNAAGLTPAQSRAISSLQKQITEHEAKLSAYKSNPMAHDHLGILKNAPNDAIRQQIIQGRIKHLEHEIQVFKNNIQKILNGVQP